MAKKSKETKKTSKPDAHANSSSVFNTLFGDTPEDSAAASLFSDSNPFRRKDEPKDLGLISSSIDKKPTFSSNIETNPDAQKPTFDSNSESTPDEQKPKKRGKEKTKKIVVDSPEEPVELIKKPKKSKGKDGDFEVEESVKAKELGIDSTEEPEEKPRKKSKRSKGKYGNFEDDLGVEGEGSEKKKKKKKRKRDEVEVEYEKKLYGDVVEKENVNVGVVVGEKRKKRENPEELMVSKEGFDDEDKLLRTVFVGNLPLKIKKKVLIKEFGSFGEVESVRIRSIPLLDSKTPRKGAIMKKQINESADSVHAYIVFKTVESAQSALGHNMAVVEGNHIRVDRACPPRKKLKGDSTPLYDNKRTIFVGNLPFDVKDEEIYQLFTHMKGLESSLEAVRVIRDPSTSLGKGIAYVLFKTTEAVNMVIRKRYVMLRDRELRLSRAKVDSTPKKNQSVSKSGSVGSRTPESNMQSQKPTLSYQGLRASKSGVTKKTSTNTGQRVSLNNGNTSNQKAKEANDRKRKRPAVAARKAKALRSDAALKAAGTKRRLGNETPDSAFQKKKARRNQ